MNEKRKYQRVTFFTEVEWVTSGASFKGTISDISEGGAYIDTLNPCPIGTLIRMKFKISDNNELRLKAVVRNSMVGMGMGVEFIDLTADQKALLHKLINSLT